MTRRREGPDEPVRLGLRANLAQFALLVVINVFVGAMAGLERSIMPAIAEQDFQLAAPSAVLSFIVVVIGGLGSLEGALVGAIIVGFVREAGITWFAEIELAVLYLIAALVLLVRPAGLFWRP